MNHLIYPLDQQKTINRFLTTGTYCQPQEFKKAVLKGNINEWLKYGFSIHENPCRGEFLEKRRALTPEYIDISQYKLHDTITVFDQERTLQVYYPFGNAGLDFSEFYFNPTYLRSYSYCCLFSDTQSIEDFLLETCGGVTLWLNDVLITDFIPFTRNMVKQQKVTLPLKQGFNKLVICLDDLAERDTDYYFHLIYLGDEKIRMCIPVPAEIEADKIYQIEHMMDDISFEKEVFISEPVELQIHNPFHEPLQMTAFYKPVADKMTDAGSLIEKRTYELTNDKTEVRLFEADDVKSGFYYFQIEVLYEGIAVGRRIGTQVFHHKLLEAKTYGIKERKQEALAYLRDVEVENVYKAAAMLHLDGNARAANQILLEELKGIELRKDCSDFHLVIVIQIYIRFSGLLWDETKRRIEEVLLNFRYWFDEPGNDVMWFFSENHALLFHICQYAAGRLFPDQIFTNSGLTGTQLVAKAEILLDKWFAGFLGEYITEWNSNAYIPVDVLGLCSLYNLTEAGNQWKEAARKALDHIFYDMALLEHKGTVMTTFGRSYEKELKGNYTAGTTSLLYIAYNKGCLNRAALAYTSFALGEYEPPAEYRQFMELPEGEAIIYKKTQGYEGYVNLYMYKDSTVQLSTALDFYPFTPGYQEHIMQATINPTAQVFVNHPGEVQPYGNGRPNFFAGNGSRPRGAQYRDLGILQYKIPQEHPVSYTHAYIPLSEFKGYIGDDHVVTVEQEDGYIGVITLNGLHMQQEGPCKYREFISPGRENVWLIKMGRKDVYGSLQAFYQKIKKIQMIKQEDREVWNIVGTEYGDVVLAEEGLLIGGKKAADYPYTYQGVMEKTCS